MWTTRKTVITLSVTSITGTVHTVSITTYAHNVHNVDNINVHTISECLPVTTVTSLTTLNCSGVSIVRVVLIDADSERKRGVGDYWSSQASHCSHGLNCPSSYCARCWQMVKCESAGMRACSLGLVRLGFRVRDKVMVSFRDRVGVRVSNGVMLFVTLAAHRRPHPRRPTFYT